MVPECGGFMGDDDDDVYAGLQGNKDIGILCIFVFYIKMQSFYIGIAAAMNSKSNKLCILKSIKS